MFKVFEGQEGEIKKVPGAIPRFSRAFTSKITHPIPRRPYLFLAAFGDRIAFHALQKSIIAASRLRRMLLWTALICTGAREDWPWLLKMCVPQMRVPRL